MYILLRVAPATIFMAMLIVNSSVLACVARRRSCSTCQLMASFMSTVSVLGIWQEQSVNRSHSPDTIIIGLIGVVLVVLHLGTPAARPVHEGKESIRESKTNTH